MPTSPLATTDRDLAGRVAVVTGANTGIGRATAMGLAARGARVVLACRSEAKTRPVMDELRRTTGNDQIEFLSLDLARLGAVRDAAQALAERGHPVHLLVNNAGLGGQRGTTADGFELAFGVNHLGHFLFTTLLLERLRASAPARIVTVASKGHYAAPPPGIDWEAVRRPTATLTGFREYAVSKLANVLFSAELARRLAGSEVTTYAVHPGVIASDIWRRIPQPFRALANAFMSSSEEGAVTSLHCATEPGLARESGLYYDDCQPRKPSRPARDLALATELWVRSEAFCAEALGPARARAT